MMKFASIVVVWAVTLAVGSQASACGGGGGCAAGGGGGAAVAKAGGSSATMAQGQRRGYRHYSYRAAPAAKPAPSTALKAAPAPSTARKAAPANANRQSVRRYSYAPSGSNRSAPSRRGGGGTYGPDNWRADRKVLGY
ncbi:MAG TPA: hypothetical protein VMV69_04285 [Pirellulales bacterium]|nr:hypothetical protein [Pirellulales bacterium]